MTKKIYYMPLNIFYKLRDNLFVCKNRMSISQAVTNTDSFLLDTYGLRASKSYKDISQKIGYFPYEILDEKK